MGGRRNGWDALARYSIVPPSPDFFGFFYFCPSSSLDSLSLSRRKHGTGHGNKNVQIQIRRVNNEKTSIKTRGAVKTPGLEDSFHLGRRDSLCLIRTLAAGKRDPIGKWERIPRCFHPEGGVNNYPLYRGGQGGFRLTRPPRPTWHASDASRPMACRHVTWAPSPYLTNSLCWPL